MKPLARINSRIIRQYVREKLEGYAERQAIREQERREGKQHQEQISLFTEEPGQ